jgi:prepilin-type processing-associated H-X9-DG protein
MYCSKCGKENLENANLCQSCGQPILAPPQIPNGKPETSKLAIWSLVLSIVGLFTCMITTIPALICGICGLVTISKSRGQLKGNGFAIAGIIIPAVSFFLLVPMAILMPALGKVRCLAQRQLCGTNLSSLGKAMQVYTNDYNDTYPSADNWCDLLIEKADVPKESFSCPSKAKGGMSYYVLNINAAGKKSSEVPPDMVLIFETNTPGWNMTGGRELASIQNHQGEGCNVLFADGHVEFVKDPNLLRWTAE